MDNQNSLTSVGPSTRIVEVMGRAPNNVAIVCRDTLGYEYYVSARVRRTERFPAAGEMWLLDRTFGAWTFAAWLDTSLGEPEPEPDPEPESFRFVEQVRFATAGTFTFVRDDYPWLRAVRVKCQGGGGGGAGTWSASAASGGGGGYAERFIGAGLLKDSEPVVVGAGGAGGANGANAGSNGGASSFAATEPYGVVGAGGGGPASFDVGGVGGGGTGDLVVPGGGGSAFQTNSFGGSGPFGGGSFLAGQGNVQMGGAQVNGLAGKLYGGGGSGGQRVDANRAGGAGARGIVLVDLYA